jgi:tRNA-splicing ligase RtcB
MKLHSAFGAETVGDSRRGSVKPAIKYSSLRRRINMGMEADYNWDQRHNKPCKIYGKEYIDEKAIAQLESAMALDWVVMGAGMPDMHLGYALPIGGVVATDGVVVPAWVGYDIGCGMCAAPISCSPDDLRIYAQEIFQEIYRQVPVGFKHNKKPVTWREYSGLDKSEWFDRTFHEKGGLKQLGTLGGGNHFIEIGEDKSGTVWIIVHSGSRNVGHTTATQYMREASYIHTGKRKAREGHYGFGVNSDLGIDYIRDAKAAQAMALYNRRTIIDRVVNAINYSTPCEALVDDITCEALTDEIINRNHNHIEFRDGLIIHRKGATHADKGMLGVIPGNMRDGSFIVRGLGNPDSLYSSSHGAGRMLGRKQAKELLKEEPLRLDAFKEEMEKREITAKTDAGIFDETPTAYKDIFTVMDYQRDLVEVVTHIRVRHPR